MKKRRMEKHTKEAATEKKEEVSIRDSLKSFIASCPLFPNDKFMLHSITDDISISDAFQKLCNWKITSVPIINKKTGVPVGVVSVMDLLAHFMNVVTEEDLNSEDTGELWAKRTELIGSPIINMQELGLIDPPYVVSSDQSTMDAVDLMLKHNAHRVLVYDKETSRLRNVISQSRILQICNVMMHEHPLRNKAVEELNLIGKTVFSVQEKDKLYYAFKLMREKKVSAVAVNNPSGKTVGVVSATDLKELGPDMRFIEMLAKPVSEFIEMIQFNSMECPHKVNRPMLVHCRPNTPLQTVIKQILFYNIHRLFVINEESDPVGVIAIGDILRIIIN